jgi:phosphohistidine phosphatase
MKRLLLLRHAKASPDGKDRKDYQRELTGRGRANAAAVGAWLHTGGYAPDLVLCSTALRTVETWKIVAAEIGGDLRVEFLDPLYLAPAKRIAALIRAADDPATLLVVGHNPGMEDCAAALVREPVDREEAARLDELREKFPTCALAMLEFDIAKWSALEPVSGTLAAFVKPKELRD